jgi:Holliday junction resolvase
VNGRGKRDKGSAGERELAKLLTDQLGFVVKRNLGQSRDGADDITIQKFRLEVKRQETLKMDLWSQQVEACAQSGEVPVLVYRRNGQPWRVCLLLDNFIPMMRDQLEGVSDAKTEVSTAATAGDGQAQTEGQGSDGQRLE